MSQIGSDAHQDAHHSRDQPRVAIAGVGLLTPLAHTAWATLTSLLAGRTLADRVERLPETIDPVNLVRSLGGISVVRHVARDPAIELAERAAREAAYQAGIDPKWLPTWLGTSKGAVAALTEAAEMVQQHREPDPRHPEQDAWLAGALGPHQYLTTHLARRLGSPERAQHVAACASSLTALHQARRALLQNQTPEPYALVVTAEAALLPMFVHSYRRLGVLAPLTREEYRQRPLDAARSGFMLSESGAAVVLKRLPPGAAPEPGQIELTGTAVANEAYDMIRPSPEMPALERVAEELLAPHPVEVLHPHAPGTAEHDPQELTIYRRAIEAAHGRAAASPALYACKGALGHGLGAAGLTALVLSWLCLRTGKRPPMPWVETPVEAAGMTLETDTGSCDRRGRHGIFAAGFGGHVAGATLQGH